MYMGARLNAGSQNVSFLAFPRGAASKRIGNDEDVETQGFGKVACATTVPMHFLLLELDVLLELLELLLVELSRADLTLSSNSCLRQGISFIHVALVECPLLPLGSNIYITSKQFLLGVAHGLGTVGPACAVLAPSLRENTAKFSEKGRQAIADVDLAPGLRGACA